MENHSPVVDFKARPTVNGVGVMLQGEAAGADLATTRTAPTSNQTIPAGYSAQSVRKYKIASGIKLTIGLGSIFKIC